MDEAIFRDCLLAAQAEFDSILAEFNKEFFMPSAKMKIGMMVGTMGAREIQNLDNDTLAKIMEVLNG